MPEVLVPGLIGKKLGMTHVFTEDGTAVPVTVLAVGPCRITQVKTAEKDGYDALQLGFEPTKDSRVNKPLKGHFAAAGTGPFRLLKEFRVPDASPFKPGQELRVEAFKVGTKVDVTGTSIGKGFTGVVKRHGFSGGPKTHGSKSHDVPGSIGGSAFPARVWPGKKLPGRAGGVRVTIKKLSVVGVDPEKNLLWLKGAVPGKRNAIVYLRPSVGFEDQMKLELPEETKRAKGAAKGAREKSRETPVEAQEAPQAEAAEAPAGTDGAESQQSEGPGPDAKAGDSGGEEKK